MRSHIQDALLVALETILKPIVKLVLQSGVSYSEFASVAKSVFVQVVTDDYQRRGRPANFSQVSAMTGISRKEVSKIRKPREDARWTPSMETSPVNTVLHEWHFDPDFSDGAGTAKPLPFEGETSFSALVSRYVSDIPAGAIRTTLQQAGVLEETSDGCLKVKQPFFYPHSFDADFIRGLAFSLGNLGSTLAYNAALHERTDITREKKRELSRLERGVWSEHLSKDAAQEFKLWVDANVPRFLEEANHLIGRTELAESERSATRPRAIGLGIYYYEED